MNYNALFMRNPEVLGIHLLSQVIMHGHESSHSPIISCDPSLSHSQTIMDNNKQSCMITIHSQVLYINVCCKLRCKNVLSQFLVKGETKSPYSYIT
jgi:hypothetical protein